MSATAPKVTGITAPHINHLLWGESNAERRISLTKIQGPVM